MVPGLILLAIQIDDRLSARESRCPLRAGINIR